MANEEIFLVLVEQRFKSEDHSQVFPHLVRLQTDIKVKVLQCFLPQIFIENIRFQELCSYEALLEPF